MSEDALKMRFKAKATPFHTQLRVVGHPLNALTRGEDMRPQALASRTPETTHISTPITIL